MLVSTSVCWLAPGLGPELVPMLVSTSVYWLAQATGFGLRPASALVMEMPYMEALVVLHSYYRANLHWILEVYQEPMDGTIVCKHSAGAKRNLFANDLLVNQIHR